LSLQQFWQKTSWLLSLILTIDPTLRHVTFSVPSYETQDEGETFYWCQGSEKENTGGLEKHQH
jgi:hypothetical protein